MEMEKRVGPEGRKLFERFLRQVKELQVRQQLEAAETLFTVNNVEERRDTWGLRTFNRVLNAVGLFSAV
jgi:hypothetical protein